MALPPAEINYVDPQTIEQYTEQNSVLFKNISHATQSAVIIIFIYFAATLNAKPNLMVCNPEHINTRIKIRGRNDHVTSY